MKKLLVLLLVFGMSSLANAGLLSLYVEVGSSPYVEGTLVPVGSTVDVYIVQGAEDTLGSGGEVFVDFENVAGATPTDLTVSPMVDFYGGWNWLLNGGVQILGSAAGADEGDFWMSKVANLPGGTPGIGSIMGLTGMPGRETYTNTNSTAMFSFTTPDDITVVSFTKGVWDGVLVSDSVQVGIPEPMTLALLGLGGLFLRRRK